MKKYRAIKNEGDIEIILVFYDDIYGIVWGIFYAKHFLLEV